MRNTCLLLIAIIAISDKAVAQKGQKTDEKFYLWTADWSSTGKTDNAAYLSRMNRINDSCWQMDTWRYAGPMYSSEQFRDERATVLHGLQIYYHPSGYVDSSGPMVNGIPDGDWSYNDTAGHLVYQKHYAKGFASVPDSFADNRSSAKPMLAGETESSFPGGLSAWQKYLSKKMQYPDRALKGRVTGNVITDFVVDSTGSVESAVLHKSVEYSLDVLSISIINGSPNWNPAYKDGRPVKSYKRQPLVYDMQEH